MDQERHVAAEKPVRYLCKHPTPNLGFRYKRTVHELSAFGPVRDGPPFLESGEKRGDRTLRQSTLLRDPLMHLDYGCFAL